MTVLLRERKLDWLSVDIIHEYSTHGPNTITTVETVGQDCSLIYDMFVCFCQPLFQRLICQFIASYCPKH